MDSIMNEDVEITLQTEDVSVETPLVADYILPTATQDTLGGIKLGSNVIIDSTGHLSVPVASTTSLGVVQAGTGINIDANGVISSNGEGYTLPEATKTTLGGVYVDDELSTTSTHPVQNAVVSLALAEATGDIDDLSTDVDNLSTGLGNLSTTVGNLSTTVGNLSTTVSNNTLSIGVNAGNISSLSTRMTNAEDNITALTNGANEMSGNLDTLLATVDETIPYGDIDDQVWTSGNIRIEGKGKIAFVYVSLEGSLTIASGANEIIYTIADDDLKPKYLAQGVLLTDAGAVQCQIATSGNIRLFNISSSSITLTNLIGNVPIVLN